jgi:hypothetical protein
MQKDIQFPLGVANANRIRISLLGSCTFPAPKILILK